MVVILWEIFSEMRLSVEREREWVNEVERKDVGLILLVTIMISRML